MSKKKKRKTLFNIEHPTRDLLHQFHLKKNLKREEEKNQQKSNLERQEMRLWERVSGVLKDQNSLWISGLSRTSTLRNPDIEAAVIKATSHDELRIDYKNFHRVLAWLRLSDVHVKPAVRCISARLQKTHSWVVAIKGLMLIHGVVSTRVAVVQLIGRLPFDLSNFKDGHSKLGKTWAHNAFIRAYYAFLDSKSILLYTNLRESTSSTSSYSYSMSTRQPNSITKDIMVLQKVQGLLDLLLQIKPQSCAANVFLIVEAMDGLVMESFDIYSRLCKMIANVVSRIETVAKGEAGMILRILQKAVEQGNELSLYFELCRDIGVERALEIPDPPKIPEEDIRLLKQMVYGVPEASRMHAIPPEPQEKKAIVTINDQTQKKDRKDHHSRSGFKTIITNNWEKFDEENWMLVAVEPQPCSVFPSQQQSATQPNPFFSLPAPPPPQQSHHTPKCQELPDLISL